MKNNNISKKGGIYIAVCCFAVLAAAIGYVGRSNDNSSQTKPEDIKKQEIVKNNTSSSQDFKKANNDIEIIVKDYEPVSEEKNNDIE